MRLIELSGAIVGLLAAGCASAPGPHEMMSHAACMDKMHHTNSGAPAKDMDMPAHKDAGMKMHCPMMAGDHDPAAPAPDAHGDGAAHQH